MNDDRPWLYANHGARGAASNLYKGMPPTKLRLTSAIWRPTTRTCTLRVTNGFLFECPRIFEAWGFAFRSSFPR